MDLYHVCSNYSPRAKNGPDLGVNFFYIYRLIKGNMKNLQVSACLLTSEVDKNKCEVTH